MMLQHLLVILAVLAPRVEALIAELRPPSTPFAEMPQPPAPNYKEQNTWLVWPGRPSKADIIPEGIEGTLASNPQADVFFIHPTTYLSNARWNARFDEDGATNAQLEDGVLRYQTSVFNGCCRIFAPRYRQAAISTFLNPGADSFAAYDLAYSDILRAFDYYLAQENHGRPFIIASHSQGSLHATRLLRERIVNNAELRRRLVAAYVVGASLPVEDAPLPVCKNARQTGCILDWNATAARSLLAVGRNIMITYRDGRYQTVQGKSWLCVNPLTWTLDGEAPASANRGAIPGVKLGAPLPRARAGVTGARCEHGRVVVSIPRDKREGFTDLLARLGSYHNHDYNLFYASIRQNAIDRVAAYLVQPQ